MAIDVYWQDGKNRHWLGDFLAKENLLNSFAAKTGVQIDEYGTTRLSAQQLRLLMSTAREVDYNLNLSIPAQESGVFILEGD